MDRSTPKRCPSCDESPAPPRAVLHSHLLWRPNLTSKKKIFVLTFAKKRVRAPLARFIFCNTVTLIVIIGDESGIKEKGKLYSGRKEVMNDVEGFKSCIISKAERKTFHHNATPPAISPFSFDVFWQGVDKFGLVYKF